MASTHPLLKSILTAAGKLKPAYTELAEGIPEMGSASCLDEESNPGPAGILFDTSTSMTPDDGLTVLEEMLLWIDRDPDMMRWLNWERAVVIVRVAIANCAFDARG